MAGVPGHWGAAEQIMGEVDMNVAEQSVNVGGGLQYIDTAHCQKVFSVKQPGTLRRWAKLGAPHIRVGREFRWNVLEMVRWLNEQTRRAEGQSAD